MGQRLQLQSLLEEKLGSGNVYFQPPATVQMLYPAIVYHRDSDRGQHADNELYRHTKRYLVTVIDRNPDSTIPDTIRKLPLCAFDRFFTANGLNHDVFNLYF